MSRHPTGSTSVPGTRPATGPGATAAAPAAGGPRLASGWAALDALLGGGWPTELAEIAGQGRASLALAAVRRAQFAGQPVAWVDGTGCFCPATAEVDLGALTLLRPPVERGARAALLAADLLLRSRAFGLLVLDPGTAGARRAPTLASWFRLARQAGEARTVTLLLGAGAGHVALAGSAAALTLRASYRHPRCARWQPLPPPALALELTRVRGAGAGRRVQLELAEERGARAPR